MVNDQTIIQETVAYDADTGHLVWKRLPVTRFRATPNRSADSWAAVWNKMYAGKPAMDTAVMPMLLDHDRKQLAEFINGFKAAVKATATNLHKQVHLMKLRSADHEEYTQLVKNNPNLPPHAKVMAVTLYQPSDGQTAFSLIREFAANTIGSVNKIEVSP